MWSAEHHLESCQKCRTEGLPRPTVSDSAYSEDCQVVVMHMEVPKMLLCTVGARGQWVEQMELCMAFAFSLIETIEHLFTFIALH